MKFSDLVGQESVTKAISNAIKLGREPHAVIFSGVRGIGKTTTARLYAKALNCEDTSTQEPCNECTSCHAITKGVHEDVVEIDGASNNGVDEIRSIKESVSYIPQRSKYKVYIIDEVHMLSMSAFNALLKTLEEPPSHVVFVFATTELHKVPQTVVGRCQTFYLQKIRLTTMIDRISEILKAEDIEFEDKAISLVAREGHGSMRDALSFLDQSIALGGGKVTLEGVSQLTSNLSAAPYIDILDALVSRNAGLVVETIERLDEEGQAFRDVCEETAKVARHGFIIKDLGKEHLDVALLGLDDQDLDKLSEISANAGVFDLNRIFRTLVKCIADMDGSALDRFIFENYLIEWCVDPGLPSVEDLMGGGFQKGAQQPARNFSQQAAPVMQNQANTQTKPRKSLMASFSEAISDETPKKNTANSAPKPSFQKQATPAQNVNVEAAPSIEFPESWRKLVDAWKVKKPLQARKLEEVHPIEYGPEKIIVAVDPAGIVGPTILKRDTQLKIAAAFKELFGFQGDFSAIPRPDDFKTPEDEASQQASVEAKEEASFEPSPIISGGESNPTEPLPASILQEKKREREERKEELIAAAKDAPVTQHLQAALDAEIGNVEITNQALL